MAVAASGETSSGRGGARLLAAAPVAVHVVRGIGAGRAAARLRADHRVRISSSPRYAELLVLAGALPLDSAAALRAVHDQVSAPRGVAAIGVGGDLAALGLGEDLVRLDDDLAADTGSDEVDPVRALLALRDDVLAGRCDRPALGPAENPVEWQGVGPHGQGGEGMMGGTPYGRPMAMPPVEGRDGLALDRLSLRLGPFLPGLPPGVALEAGLQGDVLAEVELLLAGEEPGGPPGASFPGTIRTAGAPRPDPRAAPEQEAGRRLEALAELCALSGLDAEARGVARVALAPTSDGVARLRRRLDRPWTLRAATDGIGRLSGDDRDVTGRWRRWLDEAAHALDPATGPVSDPVRLEAQARADIGRGLVGLDVGQALLTVASLWPELEHTVAELAATGAP